MLAVRWHGGVLAAGVSLLGGMAALVLPARAEAAVHIGVVAGVMRIADDPGDAVVFDLVLSPPGPYASYVPDAYNVQTLAGAVVVADPPCQQGLLPQTAGYPRATRRVSPSICAEQATACVTRT